MSEDAPDRSWSNSFQIPRHKDSIQPKMESERGSPANQESNVDKDTSREWSDLALTHIPEKPSGDTRLRPVKTLPIAVNGYKLDLSKVVDQVFKYELRFLGIRERDGTEKDLTRGPKNDVAIALRHRALWRMYEALLDGNRVFFGDDCTRMFYDCGINFYTIDELCTRDEGEQEFNISMEVIPRDARDYLPKLKHIVAKLLAVQTIGLRDTAAATGDLEERERSLLQFLEVATTQMMYKQQDHWFFGNKEYVPPDRHSHDRRLELGGGKILVRGMEKNVRYVGNGTNEMTPMAQIDAKKSPFFDQRPLIDLIDDLLDRRSHRDLLRDSKLRLKITRQLKELVFRTVHDPKNPKFFSCFGLTTEGAENVVFDMCGQEVSVYRYFLDRYNYRLRYPELPCVIQRKYNTKAKRIDNSFFPIEALMVVEGQRVVSKKQTADLVEKMIAGCRLLPQELLQENEKQRNLGNVNENNPYLRNLGIRVAESPSGSKASVLFPPAIIYKDSKIEPKGTGELDWRLSVPRGARPQVFLQPANSPRRWVVFNFREAARDDIISRFVGAFIQQAKKHGCNLNNPSRTERIDFTDAIEVDEIMQKMRKNGVEYVLFITRDKCDPVHDTMKLAEAKYNVITQHVCSKTVEKALGNRGPEMTLDNLVMKMNLKLGGINHGLGSADEFLRANRLNSKIVEQEWLRSTRMFVGIDMSHSAAQSLFERQSGKPPSEPTVVGMSFTCGEVVKMKGEYWMQTPRKVVIEDLEQHFVKALCLFKAETKHRSYPEHVFVYRSGVSEGEYLKVMGDEALAIRAAFRQIEAKEGKKLRIRLTIVVIQSNSNYRIFPKHGDSGGNRLNTYQDSRGRGDRDRGRYGGQDDRYGGERGSRYSGGHDDRRGGGDRYGGHGRGGFGNGRGDFGSGFGNAAQQNVPPGTCVDSDVVHPIHTEFLLVPHKSIMGTARPIRCTLLVDDEPRMSMDELEGITNILCYAHGIVTSPVSVPAPLYAAGDLAKRGRNNWKTANFGDEEATSLASGGDSEAGGLFRNDGSEGFFRRMSDQLASKCRHKYWA